MKILKSKALTILGLAIITALIATTFAVYTSAKPTETREVNEGYGEIPGERNEMHDHWEEMHDECMEMMDEMYEENHNSTTSNEIEESHHHHHGCP